MEPAIELKNVSKSYKLWKNPSAKSQYALIDLVARSLPLRLGNAIVERLAKRFYNEFKALDNINLRFEKGSATGIIGRNGAGKSSLLEIIAGTVSPTSGEVEVNGKLAALLELGSGFNPEFSGRDNVFLYGAILGMARNQVTHLFPQIEAFADIGSFIDQPLKTYSSGMRMRLAFAVVSFLEPAVLIIDEALAVGDDAFKRKCYSRLDLLLRKGVTFLLVSHSTGSITQLCESAHWIHQGKILLSGDSKSVTDRYHQYTSRRATPSFSTIERELAREQSSAKEESSAPPFTTAFYSDQFTPESTLYYEEDGGRIKAVGLFDLSDRPVTHITSRLRYRLKYQVAFQQRHANVFFSFLIKTPEGFPLGGSVSHYRTAAIAEVLPGEEHQVQFEFEANLAHSTYFVNVGVKANDGVKEYFVHRILDALAFRVLPVKDGTVTSFVDLKAKASITIL